MIPLESISLQLGTILHLFFSEIFKKCHPALDMELNLESILPFSIPKFQFESGPSKVIL